MGPIGARDVADVALDRWLGTDLRVRYGAATAAPVPDDLIRLVLDLQAANQDAPAAPPLPRDAEDGASLQLGGGRASPGLSRAA